MVVGMLISEPALANREQELNEALRTCIEGKIDLMKALVDTMDKKELGNVYKATQDSFLCANVLMKTDFDKGIKLLKDTKKLLIDRYGEHMGQSITTIFSANMGAWYEKQDSNKKKNILNSCNKL